MRPSTTLVGVLLALCISTWTLGYVLAFLRPSNVASFTTGDFVFFLGFLAFPIVGAVLAWKVPKNPIGWIFLIGPTIVGLSVLLQELLYQRQDAASPWTAYTADAAFFLGLSIMAGFFLGLFPSGKFHRRGWRVLGFLATGGILATLAWTIFRPCSNAVLRFPTSETNAPGCTEPVQDWFIRFNNPLGIVEPGGASVWAAVGAIGGSLMLMAMFGGAASLFSRYRSGTAAERVQLRWLLAILVILVPLAGGVIVLESTFTRESEVLGYVVTLSALIGIPLAIGIAVLRHNLLDIDRVLSRTAAFTVVALLLAIVYAFIAIWLPTALTGSSNSLAVAASTLAVAALFNPLRRRVQRVVDGRFDRTTYDAELVGSQFARELRDNVDTQAISQNWMNTASDALRPATSGVWIKQPQK